MAFELTELGIQTQTVAEILAEIETAARAPDGMHPSLDCSATSPFGQAFGIWAVREAQIQQAVRAVAGSFSVKSTGQALASVCLITGTVKRGATKSQVSETVTLTAGTTLPAGSRVNVAGDTTAVFETLEDVTNSSGITADFAATMQAVDAGPVRAPSGTLTVINTPVSGWVSAANAFDADVGKDIETDTELRVRREEEVRVQGSAGLLAIAADVSEVPGVLQVRGFENTGDTIDADGVVGHSFEIVVWDGVSPAASDNAIAQAILDAEAAGIAAVNGTAGTHETGDAIDGEGDTQTIAFTRATQLTLYISYSLTVDDSYPVDGDTQVKAATVAVLVPLLGVGTDVIRSKLFAIPYQVAGVTDVTAVTLGFSASPAGTSNLAVGSREIAIADTSRIVVTS
jgi:uncharacterized phage protein gp47/JayE